MADDTANSGAIIHLQPGTYAASGKATNLGGKVLTIAAAGSAAGTETVLDCQGGPCLEAVCASDSCAAANLTLQGFTVQNGKAAADGGCLSASNQAVVLRDMTFTNCQAVGYGGAVAVSGGSFSSANSKFSQSSVSAETGGGGAISLRSTTATITKLRVEACSAANSYGGGVFAFQTQLLMVGALIRGCTSHFRGGAISSEQSTLELHATRMDFSQAAAGGGLGDQGSAVTLESCVVESCAATSPLPEDLTMGGGLYFSQSSAVQVSGTTVFNCSSLADGGGVYLESALKAALVDSVIEANTALTNAGGLYIHNVTTRLAGVSVLRNVLQYPMGFGAGVYTYDAALTMTNCSVEGNTGAEMGVTQGGGMYVFSTYAGSLSADGVTFADNIGGSGGAIFADSVPTNITNSRFLRNHANSLGGAMLVALSSPQETAPRVHINGCTLDSNSAALSGGAFYISAFAPLVIQSTKLTNNSVIRADGGAIYVPGRESDVTLIDSTFDGNSATESRGGAIFSSGSSIKSIRTIFTANWAGIKGGAITQLVHACAAHWLQLSLPAESSADSCIFLENNSTSGGAILLEDYGMFNMTNSKCLRNKASSGGGCMSVGDITVTRLVGCQLNENQAISEGGAIRVTGSALVSSTASYFRSNEAPVGGALSVEMHSLVTASGTLFDSNKGRFHGGAIFGTHQAHVQLSDCDLSSNRAVLGGGLLVDGDVVLMLNNTNLASNTASGLVLQGQTKSTVLGCTFGDNSAAVMNGGGILATEDAELSVEGTTFSSNKGPEGGALYADASTLVTVKDSVFSYNAAEQGGAIAVSGTSKVTVTNATFVSNTASETGGAVSFLGASVGGVRASVFSKNVALVDGAGVYMKRTAVNETAPGSMKPLAMSGLTFSRNVAPLSQGAAFFEATFEPLSRTTCAACTSADKEDTVGTVPTSFHMRWPGATDKAEDLPFRVLGSVGLPIENLQVVILDAFGNLVDQDNVSIVEVSPDPRVSGLLHGVARNGMVALPPINILVQPEEAADFELNITVTSSTGAFPDIVRTLTIGLCPAGQFYNDTKYVCQTCALGSWCAAGQLMTACKDNTFSFQLGSSGQYNCSSCDSDGLVRDGYWLSPPSIMTPKPTAFNCLYQGCQGFNFTGEDYRQCHSRYDENRMCSTCAPDNFFLLNDCHSCGKVFTSIFPLLIIVVVSAWIIMNMMSDTFDTVDIFLNEVQIVTMIGSYNLNYPAWIITLLQYFGLTLFDPDIIGPECRVSYNYERRWVVTLLVPIVGCFVYLCFYLKHHYVGDISGRFFGKRGAASTLSRNNSVRSRAAEQEYNNKLIHSVTNWLDICYASVLIRCFQAFQRQVYDVPVVGSAPELLWMSKTHVFLLSLAVIVTVIYIGGLFFFYTIVLYQGQKKQLFQELAYKQRYSWLFDRYKPEYWWWHLMNVMRRIVFSALLVFAVNTPSVQVALTLPIQAVRIGLQYASSPFGSSSLDVLNGTLILGEFFFTLAVTGYNYIGLKKFSEVIFGVAIALIVGPIFTTFTYEILNKTLMLRNQLSITYIWKREAKGKLRKSHLQNLAASEHVHPQEVCEWFRPHIMFTLLLSPRAKEQRLLLRVRDRYEECKLEGLGPMGWIRHLSKPQLYAVLSQALLGAGAGNMVIARVPLKGNFCADHNNWHEEGQQHPMQLLQSVETPKGGVQWPPRLERHVSWATQEELAAERAAAAAAAVKASTPKKGGDASGKPPLKKGFNRAVAAAKATIEGVLSPRSATSSPAQQHQPGGESSGHVAGKKPPPLDLSHSNNDESDGGVYPDHDFVRSGIAEARMNMAELTLTFQRHLAMLVKIESRKKDDSLRMLIRSQAIRHILAWLTAPSSTEEDQKLLRDLVVAVREASMEEAGGLSWKRGMWCFFKNAYVNGRAKLVPQCLSASASEREEEVKVGTPRNI
eukprot:jgi/Mesen1/4311/ME000022S03600